MPFLTITYCLFQFQHIQNIHIYRQNENYFKTAKGTSGSKYQIHGQDTAFYWTAYILILKLQKKDRERERGMNFLCSIQTVDLLLHSQVVV